MQISFKHIFLILMVGWFSINPKESVAQKKVEASGFLEFMNTTMAPANSTVWQNMSGVYNRINLNYYATKSLKFQAGMRNNFLYGPLLANTYPVYTDLLTNDDGLVNMTFDVAHDSSYVLYTNIDRFYATWTQGKFETTIGRQRINWGINTVWTPNDIFNAFNYLDFDYVERAGSDAVLMQYYTGNFSSVSFAAKLDKDHHLTAAAMVKFNKWNYDFQFFGGVMNTDMVAGAGWSGQIQGAGFNGEATYFRDKDHFGDTTGILVASIGANYTLPNSLYLHVSVIYNSNGTSGPAGQGANLLIGEMSAKTLTLSKFDVFAEISYPITPLIRANLNGIVNPLDHSAYVGPNVSFNLTQNLGLMVMSQVFLGKAGTEFGGYGQIYYFRLKFSF
ncbi:MAG: hypothetical protein WC341_11075 [Bacteroidales bacterium]|jgi:hypothetical protein